VAAVPALTASLRFASKLSLDRLRSPQRTFPGYHVRRRELSSRSTDLRDRPTAFAASIIRRSSRSNVAICMHYPLVVASSPSKSLTRASRATESQFRRFCAPTPSGSWFARSLGRQLVESEVADYPLSPNRGVASPDYDVGPGSAGILLAGHPWPGPRASGLRVSVSVACCPAGTHRGRRTPFDVKGFEDGVTSRKDGRPSPRSGGESRKGAGVGPGRSSFPSLTPSGPIRPASGWKA
jgi:hypothetical protein